MEEYVNHPKHYNIDGRKECIVEMEEKFGAEAVYWFCVLNAYKYRYRKGLKESNTEEQDMKKAQWYDSKAHEMFEKMFNQSSVNDMCLSYEEKRQLTISQN
jgi:hypothetical protein